MRLRLKELKEQAEEKEKEKKVPLLEMASNDEDEVSQIKHFALTYYRSIFTEFELNTLSTETQLDFESLGATEASRSQIRPVQ